MKTTNPTYQECADVAARMAEEIYYALNLTATLMAEASREDVDTMARILDAAKLQRTRKD